MEVLDVAAGTGNVAVRAAATGAAVIASDLTPALFEAGRRRAEAAGVELEWVEADAEELPFEDGRFDAVLSTFGVMFAPRHEVAAAELVRVCKPGGTIGICAWTPTGAVGQMFETLGGHLPPPPEFAGVPVQWGEEAHVRELLEPHGDQTRVRGAVGRLRVRVARLGCVVQRGKPRPGGDGQGTTSPDDAYAALRADLVKVFEGLNTAVRRQADLPVGLPDDDRPKARLSVVSRLAQFAQRE